MAGYRLAVLDRRREARGQAVVCGRCTRVPARPDEAVAAAEQKSGPGFSHGPEVVRGSRRIARRVVEALKDPLGAAIGHVVDQHPAGSAWVRRPQDKEIRLVFDEAALVARRLVEVDDDPVLGRGGIELSLGHTPDAQVRPGFAEGHTVGKGLDRIHLDFGIGHRWLLQGGSALSRIALSTRWPPGSKIFDVAVGYRRYRHRPIMVAT